MPSSLVIVNPHASRARDPATRRSLRDQLTAVLTRRDGSPPRIIETSHPSETRPAVTAALEEGIASVVGVGGDGTLRDIAAALASTGVPMGVVPGGTGNQLAADLGIPLTLAEAVAALERARPRTIDLGQVTCYLTEVPPPGAPTEGSTVTESMSSTFTIGCGAGFDARLMATTSPELKKRVGRSAYFAQALKLAADVSVVPYRLTVDGEVIETDASIVLVGNMGQLVPGRLGLRLPLVPDDGLLDLIVVAARGPLHGLQGLADQLFRTSLGWGSGSNSLRARGRDISIEADRPEPLQVDGDFVGWGSLEARVSPGALSVLVPGQHP